MSEPIKEIFTKDDLNRMIMVFFKERRAAELEKHTQGGVLNIEYKGDYAEVTFTPNAPVVVEDQEVS